MLPEMKIFIMGPWPSPLSSFRCHVRQTMRPSDDGAKRRLSEVATCGGIDIGFFPPVCPAASPPPWAVGYLLPVHINF